MNYLNRYINYLYYLVMILMLVWYSYSKGWIFSNFSSISAKEAIMLIQNDDNVSILDVRTIPEFKNGHLEDAILIPLDALDKNLGMLKNEKRRKIIVYCRTGNRSVVASRILKKSGFTPLNVSGGIIELIKEKATIIK